MRRIATSNEFFDILDRIGNGKFVTIGYVTGANLNVPTVKRKNPLTNRMKGYPDYSVFTDEGDGEIGALVKITSYNMRYLNRQTVGKKYGEYKNSANAIRTNFGIDPIADRESYKQETTWSPNGPELYNGKNSDLQSHSYNPQNLYGVKPKGIVYAVDTDGHIMKELSQEQIKPYLKAKREVDGVAALRKMGAEEERINDYISQIQNLKFSYKNFESNSILWIAATVNGEKIVYINDNLARAVDGIDIRPEDFRAIARKRYQIDLANLQEMTRRTMSKQIIRLAESDLHKIVKESVHKILVNEGLLSGFFSKKREIPSPHVEEEPQDHVYSVKEMQWLYDNQDDLSPIERKVLRAGMWVRAMKANYHGYAKDWPNIILKDGETFYHAKDGRIRKVGT